MILKKHSINKLKFTSLILILLIVIMPISFHQVSAHPPEKISLTYDLETHSLDVTITHMVSDPEDHYIEKIDIGKNSILVLTENYKSQPSTTSFTYSYTVDAMGGDIIKVIAYCNKSGSLESELSIPHNSDNNPPDKPTIDGPHEGRTNVEYSFTFCSTDPDGDSIYYCVDWGDGTDLICARPAPSGACITLSHSWETEDTFKITVVARDTKNAESEPSTHSITLPKYKLTIIFIQKLYEIIINRLQSILDHYINIISTIS